MRPLSFVLLASCCSTLGAIAAAPCARADEPLSPEAATLKRPPARPKLTLPELLQMARERSPIIAQARSQIAIRESQVREAEWNWFPSGELTFGISPTAALQCQAPPGLANPEGLSAEDFRRRNCANTVDPRTNLTFTGNDVKDYITGIAGVAGELNVRLTQPLYTFGKIEHGKAAAVAGVEAEQARTAGAVFEAEMNVARAYWGLKAARTSRATAADGREQLAKWVEKIQEDVDADKPKFNFSQTDLQRVKVALAQVDITLAEFNRLAVIAENGLRAAVGADVDIDEEELDVVDVIEQPLEYYQREALLHRPEVRAMEAGTRAYRELQKYQFSQMLPDLGLNTSFLYRFAPTIEESTSAFDNHVNARGFGLSLGLRQPLDLAQRKSRYLHAGADADAFDAQRRLNLAGISYEIAQAWANLNEARQRSALLDRSQRLAQGWLNAMEQKLDLGMSDSASGTRDLVDAAQNYFGLRLRYYASIYDVNYDVALLRRATGVEVAR